MVDREKRNEFETFSVLQTTWQQLLPRFCYCCVYLAAFQFRVVVVLELFWSFLVLPVLFVGTLCNIDFNWSDVVITVLPLDIHIYFSGTFLHY